MQKQRWGEEREIRIHKRCSYLTLANLLEGAEAVWDVADAKGDRHLGASTSSKLYILSEKKHGGEPLKHFGLLGLDCCVSFIPQQENENTIFTTKRRLGNETFYSSFSFGGGLVLPSLPVRRALRSYWVRLG